MYNRNLIVPWIMGRNRWVMHLLFWLGWAAVLAVFFFHVVQGQVQDRTEFAIYLALHVGTFYLTCYLMAPAVFRARRHVWWRLPLYPAGMLLGLTLLLIAISIGLGGLTLKLPLTDVRHLVIVNFWPVVLPFVPGVVLGFAFYGLRWGVLQCIALHEVREFSYGLSQSLVEPRQSDLFKTMLPHLLLNLMPTLHHIVRVNYSRVEEAFDSATELLKFFARLPSGRCIPAADELRQVRELISLKEIALKQDIHIRWELDERLHELYILPMTILIPIENVLKYAVITQRDNPVMVRIKRDDDGMVELAVVNSVDSASRSRQGGLGMGLSSLRERLELLTEGEFTLQTEANDGRFSLVIRFRDVNCVGSRL